MIADVVQLGAVYGTPPAAPAPVTGQGSAILDFGDAPGTNVVETLVSGQAGILASSRIQVWMAQSTTATHNAYEHSIVPIKLTGGEIVVGTSFTIRAVSDWRLDGTFEVQWAWE